jgi:hypothetical protein
MTLYEYLRRHREDLPEWLGKFDPGDPFPREQFFASRVVCYPGSGIDGHPVKLFGSTHCAHCFVYADYGITQPDLEAALADPHQGFRGYQRLDRLKLSERDLLPNGWSAHVQSGEIPKEEISLKEGAESPFGFLEVLEREQTFDENHGARRLAVLFLGADGIAAFDALFCQGGNVPPPFAVLIEDHGFGGNYASFGQDSLLERIANRCNVLPTWLLVADNTRAWHGFRRVPDVDGDLGGMHANQRFLFERREQE